MKNLLLICSIACTPLLSPAADAGETPSTIVELFTSQGCSSCPPANEFVGSLIEDSDKLVLSYGVTYWDFLGWKDTFGDAKFTKRQKEYGQALEVGFVYTPQIVLNGTQHDSRYQLSDISSASFKPIDEIGLDLTAKNGSLYLTSKAERVLIVAFKPGWQEIDVKRGENGGRILKVANVVQNIEEVEGSGNLDIKTKPGLAYAALVHDRFNHRIIAASVLMP